MPKPRVPIFGPDGVVRVGALRLTPLTVRWLEKLAISPLRRPRGKTGFYCQFYGLTDKTLDGLDRLTDLGLAALVLSRRCSNTMHSVTHTGETSSEERF